MPSDETPQGFVPPYISFSTLTGLFEKMEDKAPPPRIDRSYLDNMSGGYQTAVITALKSLDLIGDQGEITPALIEIVQNPDLRPKAMGAILREKYAEQIALGEQNATQGQLEEVFKRYGFSGETLRKAIVFFLHACNFAQIPVSPNFRSPKRAPRKRGPKKAQEPSERSDTTANTPASTGTAKGDTVMVTLPSGETLTLIVSTSVLSLDRDERKQVLDIVDTMQDLDTEAEDAEGGQI